MPGMEFDFDDAIAELRRHGKHFASRGVLEALDAVRRALPAGADPLVTGFLATALDKFDGRYDNPTARARSSRAATRPSRACAAVRMPSAWTRRPTPRSRRSARSSSPGSATWAAP